MIVLPNATVSKRRRIYLQSERKRHVVRRGEKNITEEVDSAWRNSRFERKHTEGTQETHTCSERRNAHREAEKDEKANVIARINYSYARMSCACL